jgi:hypothetical protein
VVDLSDPVVWLPVGAATFVPLKLPPESLQAVAFDAVQLKSDAFPLETLDGLAEKLIVTGCTTVTVTEFGAFAVAVTPPDELLQASMYVAVA